MIFAFGNYIKTSAENGSKEMIHEHQQSDSPVLCQEVISSPHISMRMAEERHCSTGWESAISFRRKILNLQVCMANKKAIWSVLQVLIQLPDTKTARCLQVLLKNTRTFPIWSRINHKLWIYFKITPAQLDTPLPSQTDLSLLAPFLKQQTVKSFLAPHLVALISVLLHSLTLVLHLSDPQYCLHIPKWALL